MVQRMLIDATYPEETRVAVVDGSRLEEFDFETTAKAQLKGNIYLAKVTRVEPSLQAAFVEYGGNRHGFLAFSEIHPDYYRIPVADRTEADDFGEDDDRISDELALDSEPDDAVAESDAEMGERTEAEAVADAGEEPGEAAGESEGAEGQENGRDEDGEPGNGSGDEARDVAADVDDERAAARASTAGIETVGGDDTDIEEEAPQRRPRRNQRSYRIQEVIKRRQILLVQVNKEERGTKGAALTTYLSLAGRYCVLMPNTPRGGGVSRKIANPRDRKKMKEILGDLEVPEGMAVILRTAGLERTKTEIKRDFDYLMRLWDTIREQTLSSTAPCLIHAEGDLIKRAIRDLYTKEIDEVLVAGTEGYRVAKDFMKMLMPSHARKVQQYKEEIPLFHRYQVEGQIDLLHQPVSNLKSGGYLVINPTEALVAIDVNSGRSTRERNIEETAYRTNLEAADEAARQLRLRDLAGLIVIDFIDMEDDRHIAAVERRLKDAMKQDRARIQIGRISPFGLLELSRQRLRPSFLEMHFEQCGACGGTGIVRSVGSSALHVLRAIEEEGLRRRSSELTLHMPTDVALYLLNQKRHALGEMEERYGLAVHISRDDGLRRPDFRLERIKARIDGGDLPEPVAEVPSEVETTTQDADDEASRRRGRRRRRPGRREDEGVAVDAADVEEAGEADAAAGEDAASRSEDAASRSEDSEDRQKKRRRRGKRGGRRRSAQRVDGAGETVSEDADDLGGDSFDSSEADGDDDAPIEFPMSDAVVEATLGESVAADSSSQAATTQAMAETADADATPEDSARKPARRPRTRRKPAAATAADDPLADAPDQATESPEMEVFPPPGEAAEAAPPKRPRRPRRRPAASAGEPEPAAEASPGEVDGIAADKMVTEPPAQPAEPPKVETVVGGAAEEPAAVAEEAAAEAGDSQADALEAAEPVDQAAEAAEAAEVAEAEEATEAVDAATDTTVEAATDGERAPAPAGDGDFEPDEPLEEEAAAGLADDESNHDGVRSINRAPEKPKKGWWSRLIEG
ncbi:MAG: ribonuclease E/G [Rhodospirillaceae bacterium]|nr:ribonuclease E/G [Rhodospirillaceae bacterium]